MFFSPPFPGEQYLQVALPNYGLAHVVVSALLVVSFVFWIFVFPVWFVKTEVQTATAPPEGQSQAKDTASSKKGKKSSKASEQPEIVSKEVPLFVSALTVLGFVTTSVVVLLWCSPYNGWLPRRVFQAPLLTREECDEIVKRSMAAAERNVQQSQARLAVVGGWDNLTKEENRTMTALLDFPSGWQKSRHAAYPTTDLNLVTDPFTKDDREFIGGLLHRRLSPLIVRIFGIPSKSIRSIDIFVVRYDVGKRTKLANHSDEGDISFNILLTDDFEGGGTKFWDRSKEAPFAHVEPTEPGTVLTHSALIHHEGYTVSEGTRIILVGFTSVDRVEPWQKTWTGLSWLASFANLNFLTVKFKYSVHNTQRRLAENSWLATQWDENEYVRYLFSDVYDIALEVVDRISSHVVESLVAPKDKENFISALEDGYRAEHLDKPKPDEASWFKGQQIRVNLVRESVVLASRIFRKDEGQNLTSSCLFLCRMEASNRNGRRELTTLRHLRNFNFCLLLVSGFFFCVESFCSSSGFHKTLPCSE